MLLVALLGGLVLAPAALAKGPHAVITSGPAPVMPGVPWKTTIQLNEFRDAPRPLLIAFSDDGHVDAKVRRAPAGMGGAPRFEATMVYPTRGRWTLMLIAGKHRFSLPALSVGSGERPKDYMASRAGSEPPRQEGSLPVWVLPLLGVVLAGLGAAAATRRGSRRAPRRRLGGSARPS